MKINNIILVLQNRIILLSSFMIYFFVYVIREVFILYMHKQTDCKSNLGIKWNFQHQKKEKFRWHVFSDVLLVSNILILIVFL